MWRGPLLVLLSGGRDSVCLLGRAVEALGPGAVRALHVDHGLRDTAAERALCASVCGRLGVDLVVEALEPAPEVGNLHAWARAERYRLAEAHRAPDGWVATGHTVSDEAETVLFRLATAPGRRALLGIPRERGRVLRPLLALGVTRAQTGAWCAARGLPYADDPSNADPRFARTRVREGLLAALLDVDPAAETNVARTVAALREEAAVLDALVDEVLDDGGGDGIGVDALRTRPPALARLVLRRLAEDATGALCPRAAHRLEEVLALADGGALDLGDGARARVRGGRLTVAPTPPLPAAMRGT